MKTSSSLAVAAILLLTTQQTAFAQAGYPSAYANGGYQNFNAYQNSGGSPYGGGYQAGGQPLAFGNSPHAAHRRANAASQRSVAMPQSVYEPTLTAMTLMAPFRYLPTRAQFHQPAHFSRPLRTRVIQIRVVRSFRHQT